MSFGKIQENNLNCLIEGVYDGDPWSLEALSTICNKSDTCSKFVRKMSKSTSGLKSGLLKYCSNAEKTESIIEIIGQYVDGKNSFGKELNCLEYVDLDWSENRELFLRIMNSKNKDLLRTILPSGIPAEIETLGKIDFQDIGGLLEWLSGLKIENDEDWFVYQLASLIGVHCDERVRRRLLSELENDESPYRSLISQNILVDCGDLEIEEISEKNVSYLLGEMRGASNQRWRPFLISILADQNFVEERLLPLVSDENDSFQSNLQIVLEQVGQRHGRRYLS